MEPTLEDRPEMQRLIEALVDGTITPAEQQRLEAALRESAAVRRMLRDYCTLNAQLMLAFRTPRADPGADAARLVVPRTLSEQPRDEQSSEPPVKSPVLGFLGGVVDYVNHSRRLMFLLVAVMLCGWFVFQIGSVLLGRWWAGQDPVADRGNDRPAAPAAGRKPEGLIGGPAPLHSYALAWLSGSVGGRWQVGGPNPAAADFWPIGTEFKAGQQVNLVAGLGEITFRSGAKVVLSAPAQFSVTSALRTDLQVGKLSARVPHDSKNKGATGFTVNTPAGSVVDLGTEFGVEVTPDHKLDVQVFVGEVKINAAPGSGAEGGDAAVQVPAGKTAHVEPGKPATVVESKDKDRFQRDLTIANDSNDKQVAAYVDFMRQLKPVVWLRMEEKDGGHTIHDEMGHAAAGKLHWDGPGNPWVDGRLGKGLWLRGPKLKDYAVFSDFPKAEHGKLSVVAWAYADSRPNWAIAVGNWRERVGSQFCLGLNRYDVDRSGGDLDAGIIDRNGKVVHLHKGAAHLFPLHEWQHIAFTTDGTTLRLYRQGSEVASVAHDGLIFPSPTPQLSLGASFDKDNAAPGVTYPSWWDGKLDEVAIFNETLTAEEIKKLAAAPPR